MGRMMPHVCEEHDQTIEWGDFGPCQGYCDTVHPDDLDNCPDSPGCSECDAEVYARFQAAREKADAILVRPAVMDAAVERLTLTCAWLLEAFASVTDRDTFDFLVLGAPRELLSVMRSLDADGLIADITPEVSVPVGGGSELDTSTASASGDGQRPNRDAADLPAAGVPRHPQPTTCLYCDAGVSSTGGECGFCEFGKPLDTQEDWDNSWGRIADQLGGEQ